MTTTTVTTRRRQAQWPVPTGLMLLSLIPVLAGASRLGILATGTSAPSDSRFAESPVPVIAHIISATLFCMLGALQFVPRLRKGRPSWHRIAGRVLVPAGLVAALSGMWMAVFYTLPATDGPVLLVLRLIFGSIMVVSLLLGLRAILRRDIKHHSAWMMRAYAIGLGAGTQVLLLAPWEIAFGKPDQAVRAVLMGLAWVLNLAVAGFAIRRSRTSDRFGARSAAVR